MPVPAGGLNTSSVKLWLPGVSPLMTLTSTTIATTMIRSTVMPSSESSSRVALRAGNVASSERAGRAR